MLRRLQGEPAGDPADVSCPLDDVHAFLGRFVAHPSEHAHVAHTLWVAHTHLMDAWESTPRIAFLSPEPASGKTRALEASELLVPRPVEAVNVTAAYLFRKVGGEDGPPTVLFDEVDTIFGPKAGDHEEIRGLLNAGHRRGAVAGRCVVRGKIIETEEIPAYCAVALAGLGDLPDTILSRCVVIRMRRRGPGERVEAYRRRIVKDEGHALAQRLAAWSRTIVASVTAAWPTMPAGIEDRDSDIWEPLLAVADAAGGTWPERARVSAVTHVTDSKAGTPSLGIRLLADLKDVFSLREVMSSEEVLSTLHDIDEAPWNEIARGKPLNARGLAQRLKQYGVSSRTVRIGATTAKGYRREDLHDAWTRYLPTPAREDVTSVTSDTSAPPSPDAPTPAQESVTWVTRDTSAPTTAGVDDLPQPSQPSGTNGKVHDDVDLAAAQESAAAGDPVTLAQDLKPVARSRGRSRIPKPGNVAGDDRWTS